MSSKTRYGENFPQTKKLCERCGVEFSRYISPSMAAVGKFRFCSRVCGKATPDSDARKKCVGCGQGLRVPARPSSSDCVTGKFCSRKCKASWKLRAYTSKDEETSCINWIGTRCGNGYGSLFFNGARLAHRVAWELSNGPIPDRMHVCHRCDNPSCCNVDHLFLATHAENMADRDAKGRGPNSKLTNPDVDSVIRRIQSGESLKDIAVDFPVSYETILRISKKTSRMASC